jgi:hypothetical protein
MSYLVGAMEKLRAPRSGVCHRCGWRGMVSRVVDRPRRFRTLAQGYGRLCIDCAADLIPSRHPLTRTAPPQLEEVTAAPRRQVA